MQFLRAYLIILNQRGKLNVTVHRDLNSLLETWKREKEIDQNCAALVHVGFDRPANEVIVELLADFPKRVLVTEAARWALPNDFQAHPISIGSCRCGADSVDMSVYISIKGWGYISSEHEIKLELVQSISRTIPPEGWVKQLSEDFPDLYLVLAKYNIKNEIDFIELRNTLPNDYCNKIENRRFNYFKNSSNNFDLQEILKNAPRWLLKKELSSLDLSVRLENIFKRYRIETVEDLLEYDEESLLKMSNFGRKSYLDLINIIWDEIMEALESNGITENTSLSMPKQDNKKNSGETETKSSKDERLLDLLKQVLGTLNDRDQRIINGRLGYSGNRLTLEQIGNEEGLTRERVRQIESKIFKKINRTRGIKEQIKTRLSSILNSRKNPLLLELLEVEDGWFEGFFDRYKYLANIIENFSGGSFHLIKVSGKNIITRIFQNDWDKLVKNTCNLLNDDNLIGNKKIEINLLLESILTKNCVPELQEMLENVLKDKLIFARSGEGEAEIYVGYGPTIENMVLAILKESSAPLRVEDVSIRIKEKYSKSVSPHHACNSALSGGAKPFGMGKYGLMKHIPLEEREIEDIVNTIECIISEGRSNKQWHCQELIDLLSRKRPDISKSLNSHLMNIILERSDELISLGRLVWALKTKEADLNPTRIDISRAYVSILEEAGKPLTEKELKQRLSTKRGIDPHQQIYPNEKMIAILPGLWGLVDRDIPISQQEQETLLNILYEVLQEREKALHLTEIQKSIEDFGFRFQKKPHDYTLFRLAQSDSRFKVGQGQLLGLITWEKFNRLSLSQAVKKVMNDSSPLNSDVIWKRSEKLAERCVDKQTVVSILQNLGGYYNTERDLWEYPDSKKE